MLTINVWETLDETPNSFIWWESLSPRIKMSQEPSQFTPYMEQTQVSIIYLKTLDFLFKKKKL